MFKLTEINNAYVFIHTSDKNVIQKANKLTLGMNFQKFGQVEEKDCLSGIFYNNSYQSGENIFFSIDKINDLGDYDLSTFQFEKQRQLDDQFDSIISYCFIQGKNFIAGTDYLSLFNQYYYHKEDTFICSNNMYVVAKLCGESISDEAIFETLFFRFPHWNSTYFTNINSLNPFQQICFNEKQGLSLSTSVTFEDLLLEGYQNVSTTIDDFFSNIKNPDNLPPLLSFSGGSDSTAVLAILKAKKIDCQLASFKGHNEWDTYRIKKMAKKAKCPLIYIDPAFSVKSEDEEFKYAFLTNGFYTGFKFYDFYKRLPQKSQIFDGYSIMLGAMSDASLYPPYSEVLQGIPLDLVFKKYYSGFDPLFLNRMKDYLTTHYQDQFVNLNSPEGLQKMAEYSVSGIKSKIYSGTLRSSLQFGHQNVNFYFSRKFISYIYTNGYGVAKTCSYRDDFPGYIVNRWPLGEIGHVTDQHIFRLQMDHGASLKDLYYNNKNIKYKKKLFMLKKKLFSMALEKQPEYFPAKSVDASYFGFVNTNSNLNKYAIESLSLLNSINRVMDRIEN